jgi:hypothetical protein
LEHESTLIDANKKGEEISGVSPPQWSLIPLSVIVWNWRTACSNISLAIARKKSKLTRRCKALPQSKQENCHRWTLMTVRPSAATN